MSDDEVHAIYHRLCAARDHKDGELGHIESDAAMVDALRLAAIGHVTPEQADLLIRIYESAPKW